MERVLIVTKTRMSNAACVSGLTIDTNQSIRLLRSNGFNQQIDATFDVGQIWDLDFHPSAKVVPPHVEYAIVTRQRFIGQDTTNLASILMKRVQPWHGGPDQLFDGLMIIDRMSGYITESKGIPKCSTGYWLPKSPLNLTQKNVLSNQIRNA